MFTRGKYKDFDKGWFNVIGVLITETMLLNAVTPFIIQILSAFYKKYKQKKDGINTKENCTTKQVSVQGYIDLFGGDEFEIHFRYSNVLNIVFITMTFGAALPGLFPIALVSFFFIYVQDTYMLYYVCRMPAHFDDKLNQEVLAVFKKSPLFLLAFGFWMLTNFNLLPMEYAGFKPQEIKTNVSINAPR